MQKTKYFHIAILCLFFLILSFLFFLLGQVSTLWNQDAALPIQGVTFASPHEVTRFLESLGQYDPKADIPNEIEIFEKIEQQESKQDAKYVASSRGKYFYPIGSVKGSGLSESSRIYFASESEAISNGYIQYEK